MGSTGKKILDEAIASETVATIGGNTYTTIDDIGLKSLVDSSAVAYTPDYKGMREKIVTEWTKVETPLNAYEAQNSADYGIAMLLGVLPAGLSKAYKQTGKEVHYKGALSGTLTFTRGTPRGANVKSMNDKGIFTIRQVTAAMASEGFLRERMVYLYSAHANVIAQKDATALASSQLVCPPPLSAVGGAKRIHALMTGGAQLALYNSTKTAITVPEGWKREELILFVTNVFTAAPGACMGVDIFNKRGTTYAAESIAPFLASVSGNTRMDRAKKIEMIEQTVSHVAKKSGYGYEKLAADMELATKFLDLSQGSRTSAVPATSRASIRSFVDGK